eukprot:g1493.t1
MQWSMVGPPSRIPSIKGMRFAARSSKTSGAQEFTIVFDIEKYLQMRAKPLLRMTMEKLVEQLGGRSGLQELVHFLREFNGEGAFGRLSLDSLAAAFTNYDGLDLDTEDYPKLIHLISGGRGAYGLKLQHSELEDLIKAEEDCIQLQREWAEDGISDYEVQQLQRKAVRAAYEGVRFFKEKNRPPEAQDLRMEGCAQWLTSVAQQQRQDVKGDRGVRRLFKKWWKALLALHDEEDESSVRGALTQEQYVALSVALITKLAPPTPTTPTTAPAEEEARATALREWRREPKVPGQDVMDFDHFYSAMFEALDVWVDSVDVGVYERAVDIFKETSLKAETERLVRARQARAERARREAEADALDAAWAAVGAAEEAADAAADAPAEAAEEADRRYQAATGAFSDAVRAAKSAAKEAAAHVLEAMKAIRRLLNDTATKGDTDDHAKRRKKKKKHTDTSAEDHAAAERERLQREKALRKKTLAAVLVAKAATAAAEKAAERARRQALWAPQQLAVLVAKAAAWSAHAAALASRSAVEVVRNSGTSALRVHKLYLYYRRFWVEHLVVKQAYKGSGNRCLSCCLKRMLKRWHVDLDDGRAEAEDGPDAGRATVTQATASAKATATVAASENEANAKIDGGGGGGGGGSDDDDILNHAFFTFPPQLEWVRECRCGLQLDDCANLKGVSFNDIFGMAWLLFEQRAMAAISIGADGHSVVCDTATMAGRFRHAEAAGATKSGSLCRHATNPYGQRRFTRYGSVDFTVSAAGERMYQINHGLEERQREQRLNEIYRQRHEEVHHVPADDMLWSRPRNAVLGSSAG